MLAGGVDERLDHAVELGACAHVTGGNADDAVTDGEIDLAQDGRIEGELVVEVVVDHGFVDAGATRNAVDAGGGKAAGGKLGRGGLEDAVAGGGAAGRGHD